ncbi:DivIVA domain-containing protein [Nocardioides marmoribigeumensis]|uniref:DivIVA domain-containing protein n=1 Tax=Nocardioides marmoribigeumensis TaxID=433649 RepID=A0ABU2BXE4_9ACTN|nr:DivIVA domain-containing protein [Nocardioides marmoribigeumensis]MDR7363078.1 DivIVA domain-containing protein [Nocardioides marmoribigeumensis]
MMWFFSVLIVAVMGVAAVAATGRLGGLSETYDDRPDSRVPADGPLTAEDLEAVRFTSALRGYRMSEVDALLDRLVEELRAAQGARPRPADAEPVPEPEPEQEHGVG